MGGGASRRVDKPASLTLAHRYRVDMSQLLGSGSFGSVYAAVDEHAGTAVAAKLARTRHKTAVRILERECMVYRRLTENPAALECFPRLQWSGTTAGYVALVLSMHGPSLRDVLELMKNRAGRQHLREPSLLVVGIKAIQAFSALHQAGFVHRDVKPANFLMGADARHTQVLLVDFGLSARIDVTVSAPGTPRRRRQGQPVLGNEAFASRSAHEDQQVRQCDDLESLVFMLIYLACGVPWDHAEQPQIVERQVLQAKKDLIDSGGVLAERSVPAVLQQLLQRVTSLDYHQVPPYQSLIQDLSDRLATITGGKTLDQVKCDWLM